MSTIQNTPSRVTTRTDEPAEVSTGGVAEKPRGHQAEASDRNVVQTAPDHLSDAPAEQAAPALPEVPSGAWTAIEGALTRSSTNLFLTQADAQRANEELVRLDPDQFHAAVERMARDGLLEVFTANLSVREREQFLLTAAANSYLEFDLGQSPQGPLEPPAASPVFRNDPTLPHAVREAIHDHTVACAIGYFHAYEGYLDRYVAAVDQAKSGAELRALGPPIQADPPRDHLSGNHPATGRYARDYLDRVPYMGNHRAQLALSDRQADLRGEARAGSVFVEGKLKIESASGAEAGWSFRQHLGDSARDESKVTIAGTYGAAVVGVEHDLKKDQTIGLAGVRLGTATEGLKSVVGTDGTTRHEFKTGPVSVKSQTGASGQVTGAEVKIAGFGAGADKDGVSLHTPLGKAYVNPTEGRFGGTLAREFTVNGGKATIELGGGFNGLSTKAARHALQSEGTHAIPPELERGTPWTGLSSDARARVERNLWTQAEWTEALARRR